MLPYYIPVGAELGTIALACIATYAGAKVYGKGRVACVLAAPCGVSGAKKPLFCEAESWPAVLGGILDWLKANP